jgi:hypothetical protein
MALSRPRAGFDSPEGKTFWFLKLFVFLWKRFSESLLSFRCRRSSDDSTYDVDLRWYRQISGETTVTVDKSTILDKNIAVKIDPHTHIIIRHLYPKSSKWLAREIIKMKHFMEGNVFHISNMLHIFGTRELYFESMKALTSTPIQLKIFPLKSRTLRYEIRFYFEFQKWLTCNTDKVKWISGFWYVLKSS